MLRIIGFLLLAIVSTPPAADEVSGLPDCFALEQELAQLESESHSRQPEFYGDPVNGAVLWGSLFWAPALSYYGYSGYKAYRDESRLEQTGSRISALRRHKAELHCYER